MSATGRERHDHIAELVTTGVHRRPHLRRSPEARRLWRRAGRQVASGVKFHPIIGYRVALSIYDPATAGRPVNSIPASGVGADGRNSPQIPTHCSMTSPPTSHLRSSPACLGHGRTSAHCFCQTSTTNCPADLSISATERELRAPADIPVPNRALLHLFADWRTGYPPEVL